MPLILYSYIADLIFGDPRWFPHPVKGIGKLIRFFEKVLESKNNNLIDRIKGILLVTSVVGICGGCAYLFIHCLSKINFFWENFAWIFLAYTTLATRDLIHHARAVLKNIKNNHIERARQKLSLMVGRDTKSLSKEQIITSTIETIAENTSDGIIAPLFYLFIGGPILAICYKAVNTLDSMIGYKNEKYIHLGWFAAKLDDVMNFFPARITGILIIAASFILRKDTKNAFRIMIRDGQKHPSPNSAITEAAMAGALGTKLGGPRFYQGNVSNYSYIGEEKRTITSSLIGESLLISFLASFLMLLGEILLQWII
jgi:adenosylcobinamide-phosphate synthase